MTIASEVQKVTLSGNGVATSFSFSPIVIFDSGHLDVTYVDADGNETTLTEGTGSNNYSVTLVTPNALPSLGSITYPAAGGTPLPTGASLIIRRILPLLQPTDLENEGGYEPEVQEAAHDRVIMITQQLQEQIDRAIQIALAASGVENFLPAPIANYYLAWNSTGTALISAPGTTSGGGGVSASIFSQTLLLDETAAEWLTGLGVSSFIQTLLDDANASTALSTLGVSAFAKTLLDDADAAALLTTLGVSSFIQTLLDDTDAATARATLGIPYDVSLDCGTPTNSSVCAMFTAVRAVTISSAATHKAAALTANDGTSQTFSVRKNGSQVATVAFANAATTGTFAFDSGNIVLAAGDTLHVVAPAGIEATALANVSFTFLATA